MLTITSRSAEQSIGPDATASEVKLCDRKMLDLVGLQLVTLLKKKLPGSEGFNAMAIIGQADKRLTVEACPQSGQALLRVLQSLG